MPLPQLETPRLRLRPFTLTDGPRVRELAGDYGVAATTLLVPHPYPEGAAEVWIATHENAFATGEQLNLAITDRDMGELIGAIGLVITALHHRAELGYWIGVPYWGRGYCTEASRAVVGYGFESLGLRRVQATHFSRNPASGRVMQKIGMRHEGTLRSHTRKWEQFEDVELYAVLASEWVT